MTTQPGAHPNDAESALVEGLRERKKRLTRQLISDTATGMFLAAGFDEVRVADVAAACGVSEKTVYNYFPTKESLILDRFDVLENDVRGALERQAASVSPVEAVVAVIVADVRRTFERWEQGPRPFDPAMVRRFGDLVGRTPALGAAQREMTDRMAQAAARAMAARAAVNPDDPEPQIAANAIVGLWRIQHHAMWRYADGTRGAPEVCDAVITDVRRAARLIDTGLWSFGLAVHGSGGRDQVRLAAEAAGEACKQVLSAIRQARRAWRQVEAETHQDHRRVGPDATGRTPSKGDPPAT